MEVILKATVDNLGMEGDIVKVKPGYARNYLIPQNKAEVVNKSSLARLKQQQQAIEARKAEEKKAAEKLAAKLEKITITIERMVGEDNRLFGSVSTKDIAEYLADKGIEIDRKAILLNDPIKELGERKINVKVGYQMTAPLSVLVVPEGGEEVSKDEKADGQEEAQVDETGEEKTER